MCAGDGMCAFTRTLPGGGSEGGGEAEVVARQKSFDHFGGAHTSPLTIKGLGGCIIRCFGEAVYLNDPRTNGKSFRQYPASLVSGLVRNYFTEMCSGSEAGSYLRLIDFCITQL